MKKARKSVDERVSITIHPSPAQALKLQRAAVRAGMTRHALVMARVYAEPVEDTPILACLGQLLAILHRLEKSAALDSALRAELLAVVELLAQAARAEVDG